MFRVNTFVNFFLSFIIDRENKQAGEEIHYSFSSLKLSKHFWTKLGMIPEDTLWQKHSLH